MILEEANLKYFVVCMVKWVLNTFSAIVLNTFRGIVLNTFSGIMCCQKWTIHTNNTQTLCYLATNSVVICLLSNGDS